MGTQDLLGIRSLIKLHSFLSLCNTLKMSFVNGTFPSSTKVNSFMHARCVVSLDEVKKTLVLERLGGGVAREVVWPA